MTLKKLKQSILEDIDQEIVNWDSDSYDFDGNKEAPTIVDLRENISQIVIDHIAQYELEIAEMFTDWERKKDG